MDAPEEGFVIAVQYWSGDETRALRLARLLADIEAKPRHDVTLALCRRHDCPESDDMRATLDRCRMTFATMAGAVEDPGLPEAWEEYSPALCERRTGHPDGANALWSGTVKLFAERWQRGDGRPSIFTIEHDGCPLSVDWIDRLKAEHERALRAGKRISGCMMELPGPTPHPNGTLMMHLSTWVDRPSLHTTPLQQAWDVYHRVVLGMECAPTSLIKNIYGARGWSPAALAALAKETAWLSSTKDDSALEWAERTLRGGK